MLPVPNPAVIYKPVSDSGVLLHTEQEVYFGLNTVGVRVWELLPPACSTLEQLCDRLYADYPEADPTALRSDVAELLADLAQNDLVIVHDAESNRGNDAAASAA